MSDKYDLIRVIFPRPKYVNEIYYRKSDGLTLWFQTLVCSLWSLPFVCFKVRKDLLNHNKLVGQIPQSHHWRPSNSRVKSPQLNERPQATGNESPFRNFPRENSLSENPKDFPLCTTILLSQLSRHKGRNIRRISQKYSTGSKRSLGTLKLLRVWDRVKGPCFLSLRISASRRRCYPFYRGARERKRKTEGS